METVQDTHLENSFLSDGQYFAEIYLTAPDPSLTFAELTAHLIAAGFSELGRDRDELAIGNSRIKLRLSANGIDVELAAEDALTFIGMRMVLEVYAQEAQGSDRGTRLVICAERWL